MRKYGVHRIDGMPRIGSCGLKFQRRKKSMNEEMEKTGRMERIEAL